MGFKIDLHIHSKYSGDNDSDPEEIVISAIEAGLDGIAFTEHYSFEASETAERLREKYNGTILILRGVEYSAADGHCLVFGVNTDGLSRYLPSEDLIRAINGKGGVVIPSHPYRGINSIGDAVKRTNGICAIEGHNGNNMYAFNTKAVAVAQELNLPFTGGSDAHEPKEVGSCYTEFSNRITYENLIELLRAGNYHGVDTRKISRLTWQDKN